MAKNTGGVSFKTGVVIEAKVGFAKVRFDDLDALVSQWLPITYMKTLIDQAIFWLDVGEHVQCLMDDRLEDGCIIGAIYSDTTQAPAISADEIQLQCGGGVTININRASGQVTVAANSKIRFDTPLLEVTGEVKDLCDTIGKTMSDMRNIYNMHTHSDPQGGSVGIPNQAM